MCSMVIDGADSEIRPASSAASEEADVTDGRHGTGPRRIAVKELEARALVGAEIVFDIIAQVSGAELAVLRDAAKVPAADLFGVTDAVVARRLQGRDVAAVQRPRPPGPERPHEGQPRH